MDRAKGIYNSNFENGACNPMNYYFMYGGACLCTTLCKQTVIVNGAACTQNKINCFLNKHSIITTVLH